MIYLTAFYKVRGKYQPLKKSPLNANQLRHHTHQSQVQILEEPIPNWVNDLSLEELSPKGVSLKPI